MNLKQYAPTLVGVFTLWISNGQLESFSRRYEEICARIDATGAYGECGYDTSFLFYTCILAAIGAGMLTHYFVVKEHA